MHDDIINDKSRHRFSSPFTSLEYLTLNKTILFFKRGNKSKQKRKVVVGSFCVVEMICWIFQFGDKLNAFNVDSSLSPRYFLLVRQRIIFVLVFDAWQDIADLNLAIISLNKLAMVRLFKRVTLDALLLFSC